jgi:hypothetical protein
VATSWFIDAVIEAAELQRPALIEAQDKRTHCSGCRDERGKPMHQANNGSAEREAVQARHQGNFGRAGSRGGKAKSSPFFASASASAQKFRGRALRLLCQPVACELWNKSSRSGSATGYRPAPLSKALPNPSLKPSPNSKTPGRRYSASVHFLQRRPGVFLPVPA